MRKIGGYLFLAILISIVSCQEKSNQEEKQEVPVVAEPAPPEEVFVFGIPEDSVIVSEGRIRRNQFLATILQRNGIEGEQIHQVSKRAEGVIDLRKIKSGKHYTMYRSGDSAAPPKVLVYKDNPIDEYAFYLQDSIRVEHIRNPVDTVRQTLAGTIKSSLYVTILDLEANPELVHKLSEIYAWEIDFFHLDLNDQFRLIFDELFVNGESVGIHRIHAVEFSHRGTPFQAYHYPIENEEDYYDEAGQSLRKTFLKAPLRYSRISSRYSGRRYHPVLKRYKSHKGTDYAAPTGTPIYSVGDGVVTEARYAKYNGNYVKIRHNSVYSTQYLHMSKIKSGVKPGKVVKQGEVIGYVGQTGLANGPHCCFRFWKNGYQVDHQREKIPATKPVPEERLQDYLAFIRPMKRKLRKIHYPEDKFLLDSIQPEIATSTNPVIRSSRP